MITLVPIAPMHAKEVFGSNSPAALRGGNTNLCQADLAEPAVLSGRYQRRGSAGPRRG
jgi:hypothetical protein